LPTSREVSAELAILVDRWQSLTPYQQGQIMAIINGSDLEVLPTPSSEAIDELEEQR
jgi:hypothetical protein